MNDELCSGGNLIEKSAAVKRGTRSGLLIHKGGELFPKKIRLTENEILEKKLAEAQGYVEKERERRKSELPFVHSPLVEKEGTSEGAKLGWETRRGGGGAEQPRQEGASVALSDAESVIGLLNEYRPKISSAESDYKMVLEEASERGERKPPKAAERTLSDLSGKVYSLLGQLRSKTSDAVKRGKDFIGANANPKEREDYEFRQQHAMDDVDEMTNVAHTARAIARRMGESGKSLDKEGTSEGAKAGWETRRGGGGGKEVPGSFAEVALAERIRAGISPDERAWAKRALAAMSRPGSPRQQARAFAETLPKPTTEKTGMVVAGQISKDMVEKIMRDGGWDKLPLTDKAREIVEDAISRGAKPATEYTGKLMVEHAIPEEPPAFTRPQRIKVGDTVIPLSWVGVCLQGAKFDLPSVPEAARVKKMYTGPAKVTKESFPYGKFPRDLSKVETVVEDRLWALELEPVGIKKDGDDSYFLPVTTRDTTLVLRLDPQATPSGEVNPGVSQRD
jgi:hypothetical protein